MTAHLKPKKLHRVYDLVEEVGHDMSDWQASAQRCPVKANPKYCYEWSYSQPGRPSILNLWHEMMDKDEATGEITISTNFRPEAFDRPATESQKLRGSRLDEAVRNAWQSKRDVRIIINDGKRRKNGAGSTRSYVLARELDEVPWQVAKYDDENGACVLKRR